MRVQSSPLALASGALLACSLVACAPLANREAVVGLGAAQGAVSLADGGELRLEETWGHVVVLAFFTTWCPSSPATLRAVEELRVRNAATGLEVIAVGEGATASDLSAFAVKHGVRAWVAIVSGGVLARQLGLPTVPAVVVIARDGTIRHVHGGFHGEDDRDATHREVTALLEAPMPPSAAEQSEQVADR
jgi:peroxiredoxin